MPKAKRSFQCTACGATQSKWAGQCPDCQSWNTIEEFRVPIKAGRASGYPGLSPAQAMPLSAVSTEVVARESTGLDELDRVLGGGLVNGSVVLLGGDPGIGKSTLLLQATVALSGRLPCLYVSGEESLQQIGMRAQRLGLDSDRLQCLTETCVEHVLEAAAHTRPRLMIVDSIQTLYSTDLDSAPGSVSQVRESAARLVQHAKTHDCTIVLVGHVTKEGALAGPRVLEHMVDAVLYFESDSGSRYRVIRSFKNRFGTVNEIGVFAMTDRGLKQVSNPSAIFLSGRSREAPGSIVTVTRQGTRPLLLEIQALVDDSALANPRRVAVGLEHNRLAMLLAVLNRHTGTSLAGADVFVNVVGGLRISETASDLAVALAIVSSRLDRQLANGLAAFGEVGLSGEIRPVYNGEERLREAAAQGFERIILPAGNAPRQDTGKLKAVTVQSLSEALQVAFH